MFLFGIWYYVESDVLSEVQQNSSDCFYVENEENCRNTTSTKQWFYCDRVSDQLLPATASRAAL